jgi:cytochrome c-type biogenesis protein
VNSGLALGYVFGLGMVAVFNPCGFAMLPAWVAYFVASDQESTTAHRGVLRALTVVAVLTAGFVAVFLVVGLMIQLTASSLVSRLPWLSIALGAAMVLLSIWLFRGSRAEHAQPMGSPGALDHERTEKSSCSESRTRSCH